MKRIFSLFVAVVLLCLLPVQAQVKRLSREAIDSIRNSKQFVVNDSILSFSVRTVDFGTIYESDTARIFSFPFRNVSGKRMVIKSISSNCGCIHPYCEKYEFEPQENGTVFVKFNPKGRSGTVDNTVFVYVMTDIDFYASPGNEACSAITPVARLTLLGNVVDLDEWRHLPLSMGGTLRLKHKKVVFEPVRPGTSPQMRIPCANVGKTDMRLFSKLLPDFVEFTTEPAEIAPGEEGDVVIRINGDKLPKIMNDSYSLLVDGIGGRVSDRMIEIRIENNKE